MGKIVRFQYVVPPAQAHLSDDNKLLWLTQAVNRSRAVLRATDNECPGLRIIIRPGGACSFHVQYRVAGRNRRPTIMLGSHPEMPIDQARALTKTIVELAHKGIDVEDGLHKRLMRELQEQGTNWRA